MRVNWAQSELDRINSMMVESWEHNNLYMTEDSGRPLAEPDTTDIDEDGNTDERLTVSETVGYKLFMEVLMAAKARSSSNGQIERAAHQNFERVWRWAKKNLQRRAIEPFAGKNPRLPEIPENKRDALLAWRYAPGTGVIYYKEKRADGVYVGGLDGAPDGDLFTVAALRFAAMLWPERMEYLDAAKDMAKDIYAKYVVDIEGEPYLLAGDGFGEIHGINPSYSFEAIYDMMEELDPPHAAEWQRIKRTSMKAAIAGADSTLMAGGSLNPSGKVVHFESRQISGSSNMPPNWLTFNGQKFQDNEWFDSIDWICGWDGLRTLWMKAAYFLYDGNETARHYLQDKTGTKKDFGPYGFLRNYFSKNGRFPSGFGMDGSSTGPELLAQNLVDPNPFSLGIYLGYFYAAGDKDLASKMLEGLANFYHPKKGSGEIPVGEGTFARVRNKRELNYFGDYWAWFGLAMASGSVEDVFGRYKDWRAKNGLRATILAPIEPAYFEEAKVPATFKNGQKLSGLSDWISPFDGCKKRILGGYLCRGKARDWYLGGVGFGINSGLESRISGDYKGILLDVDGRQGRVKVELHVVSHPQDATYIYQTLASNASPVYIPFDEFREEIGHQPNGKKFKRENGIIYKIQLIGLGTESDSYVDFAIKNVQLIER